MTYKQVRDLTLKLLMQYSIAGSTIPGVYNNQQDYLLRIPGLVNDAVMEIATTVRKIPEFVDLSAAPKEEFGNQVRVTLPDDFYQFMSGSVMKTKRGELVHTNAFRIQGKNYMLLPKDELENYQIIYYRYPKQLSENPADEDELDNVPETHHAIPYYVASMLVSYDDAFLCSLMMNAYNDKVQKMYPDIAAEAHQVSDRYSFYQGVE